MKEWFKQLEILSHTSHGIVKVGALILLIGASLSAFFTLLDPWSPQASSEVDVISRLLARSFTLELPDDLWKESGPRLPADVDWIFQGPEERWLSRLTLAVKEPTPPQGTCFALGLWHWHQEEYLEAVNLFQKEHVAYPHPLVKEMALESALSSGDPQVLDALISTPEFQKDISARFELTRAIAEEDWNRILHYFPRAQLEGLQPLPVLLTLVSGTIWTFLIFSMYPVRPPARLITLGVLAIGLGALSTWPTVLGSIWMDFQFGWTEGTDFFSTLFYMLVSVGLREEVFKVLLFSPLLLYTRREGRDLEALLLGALVGLGFAIEENVNYFSGFGDGVAVSRFVSANMLHFFLTGITSLALTRAVREPGKWAADSLQVLAFAIGLHAIYNTLLSQPVPGLGQMGTFAFAALTGCAALFFRELMTLAPLRIRKVSRTAILVWGVCILFCLELGWAVTRLPFDSALNLVGQAALASVFTGYIFVHYMREPIR